MYFLLVSAIVILKILLCKGFTVGILLFLFWIAGKILRFNSDEWHKGIFHGYMLQPQSFHRLSVTVSLDWRIARIALLSP